MSGIIITNKLSYIRCHLPKKAGAAAFIVLNEDMASAAIRRFLIKDLKVREIAIKDSLGLEQDALQAEFCAAMRNINAGNNSIPWWAMNFTSKNPLSSKLFENTVLFLCIRRIMAENADITLVVISGNRPLIGQLRTWAAAAGFSFKASASGRFKLKDMITDFTPLCIFLTFSKVLFRKAVSRALLGRGPGKDGENLLIVTQFEDKSVNADGVYSDVYFSGLKDLLMPFYPGEGAKILTLGYAACGFTGFVNRLNKRRAQNRDIYPLDHFIRINDLIRALYISLRKYFSRAGIKGEYRVFDSVPGDLLHAEIRKSIASGQFLVNMAVYFSAAAFLKAHKVRAVYYPFENRSWEKMLVSACRKNCPGAKIIGYQHSSIVPRHLNFSMQRGEYSEMPAPDKIITLGDVTRGVLENWNFPKDILKTGCALRQSAPQGSACGSAWKDIKTVLVALASNVEEYIKVLMFLEEALGTGCPYDIVIRPHPIISFQKALAVFTPAHLKYRLSHLPLKDDLQGCDLMLYASSTLCLEAVAIGKPVIYLELDNFLSSDPMFNTGILKWSCGRPEGLKQLIAGINAIDKDLMRGMQKSAKEYTEKYFYKVDKAGIANFVA